MFYTQDYVCLLRYYSVHLYLFLKIDRSSVLCPVLGLGTNVLEYVHKGKLSMNLGIITCLLEHMSLISFSLLHHYYEIIDMRSYFCWCADFAFYCNCLFVLKTFIVKVYLRYPEWGDESLSSYFSTYWLCDLNNALPSFSTSVTKLWDHVCKKLT